MKGISSHLQAFKLGFAIDSAQALICTFIGKGPPRSGEQQSKKGVFSQ